MKLSKYLLSAFALVAAFGGALAFQSQDFINDGTMVIAVASAGPHCPRNRVITCTFGINTGIVLYDTYVGALVQNPSDRKMRFPGDPDPY